MLGAAFRRGYGSSSGIIRHLFSGDASGGGAAPAARISVAERDVTAWPCDCLWLPTDAVAKAHPFERDSRIRFEEGPHLYYIDGSKTPESISVTGFVGAPLGEFDAQTKLASMSADKKAKYGAGLSDREIARMWKQDGNTAARLGTKMHAAIEVALNTGYWSLDPEIQPELRMAQNFVEVEIVQAGLEVWRTEPIVFGDFTDGTKLPGSVDCLCRDRVTGEFTVMDWKRCKPIEMTVNGRFGHGEPPFDRCECIKYYKYSLQLHTYRYIFEKHYGIRIPPENLYMVSFHPTAPSYCKLQAAPLANLVEHMFENHAVYVRKSAENKAIKERVDKWMAEKEE